MSELEKRLLEKGWSQKDIEKAMSILERGKMSPPAVIVWLNFFAYWVLLVLAIVANFVVSVVMVPFLLIVKGPLLFGLLIFLGMFFGAMFVYLLENVELLQEKHLVMTSVFIPALALINVYIIASLTLKLQVLMNIPVLTSPGLISMVYFAAFLVPFAFHRITNVTGHGTD